MKLPYGYVLAGEEIAVHEEKANVVRSIFEYYLAGASLGKIVDMLVSVKTNGDLRKKHEYETILPYRSR